MPDYKTKLKIEGGESMDETETAQTRKKSEAQKEKELKKILAFLKAVIPNHWDKYDYVAMFDSSLTYLENKNRITEDIKTIYGTEYLGSTLKEQAAQAMAQQEKWISEENARIEEEVDKYNNELQYAESKELDVFYSDVDRALTKLCNGFNHLVFIKGRGGIGKSRRIRHILTKTEEVFIEVTGEVTEAYLYRLFYENNGKTIWFKDVTKLLRGLSSLNLLKSACETEKQRLLTKSSYSKQQDDIPNMFNWKGKIIFDYNEVGPLMMREDFEALKTRGDFIELAFCNSDMQIIMRQIAKSNWEKEVTEFLIENFDGVLNLRVQWKAFNTYRYAKQQGFDWKQEVTNEIGYKLSEIGSMIYTLIGNKAVKINDLRRLLLRNGKVTSIRTATNRVRDWLAMEELYKWSIETKNFYVSIRPMPNRVAKATTN